MAAYSLVYSHSQTSCSTKTERTIVYDIKPHSISFCHKKVNFSKMERSFQNCVTFVERSVQKGRSLNIKSIEK
jgi:hypothetical protein